MSKQNTIDKLFLRQVLDEAQTLSKCQSYKVAAKYVKDGRTVATGVNGSLSGAANCDELFESSKMSDPAYRKKHREWSMRHEIHAEMNGLAYAAKYGISVDGCTVYVTLSPCENCLKTMAAAGVVRVVYHERYDHIDPDIEVVAEAMGIKLDHITDINP